jgi:hypothetical protein
MSFVLGTNKKSRRAWPGGFGKTSGSISSHSGSAGGLGFPVAISESAINSA